MKCLRAALRALLVLAVAAGFVLLARCGPLPPPF